MRFEPFFFLIKYASLLIGYGNVCDINIWKLIHLKDKIKIISKIIIINKINKDNKKN